MSQATRTQTGLDALAALFARTRAEGRAAFLPYYPIGYPTYTGSLDAIQAMAGVGVDGFEIGIPFSDPLADGPIIQAATQVALRNGITVRRCLDAVRELRARGVAQPMLLMGYLNPLLAYWPDAFTRDARAAGADGLIPDLPPEEAEALYTATTARGLDVIFLLAPTSDSARLQKVTALSGGFVYLVSIVGVTGARESLTPDLAEFVARVRAVTEKPLAVGFGIATPEQAAQVAQVADGIIVGSALVKAVGAEEDPAEAARAFVAALHAAI